MMLDLCDTIAHTLKQTREVRQLNSIYQPINRIGIATIGEADNSENYG
jgi:hypothetical protein